MAKAQNHVTRIVTYLGPKVETGRVLHLILRQLILSPVEATQLKIQAVR